MTSLWVGCLLCFGVVGRVPVIVVAGLATFGVMLRRDHSRWTVALSGGLLLLGGGGALNAWQLGHNATTRDAVESNPIAVVTFRVLSDPTLAQSSGFSRLTFENNLRFSADVLTLDHREMVVPAFVTIPDSPSPGLGSIWRCPASLHLAEGPTRFAAFVQCRRTPTLVENPPRFQSLAGGIRTALQKVSAGRHPTVDGALLLPGLVLGDTSSQTERITTALMVSGLGHLTAVSGANVAIVIAAVAWLLRFTGLSPRWRYVVLLSTVLAFLIVARPSASVVRASVMAAIALTVWVMGAQKRADTAVLAAGFILLLIDPWLALSWGFALSLAATLGLVVLPKLWGVTAESPKWKVAMSAAAAAALATTPILIAMGSTPTFATIPANIAAEILVAPATILGVVAAVGAVLQLAPVAWLCADVATVCAHGIVIIATTFSNSPLAVSVVGWQGFLIAGISIWWWRYRPGNTLHWVAVLLLGCGVIGLMTVRTQASGLSRPWELYVCDVGQGDAALINLGGGAAMLVDAGPDPKLIDQCLSNAGVSSIRLFVASHFHQDHVGGVEGVVRNGRKIERALTSRFAYPAIGAELVAARSATRPEVAEAGMAGRFGSVSWEVLMAELPSDASDADGTTINSSSVVLLVHTAHWSILFTGDIETSAQELLMQSVAAPQIDILKVPHHGSRSQAGELPVWSQAHVAWISVGADNPYGHPHAQTLAAYKAAGLRVLMTRDCGAIFATPTRSLVTSRSCSAV